MEGKSHSKELKENTEDIKSEEKSSPTQKKLTLKKKKKYQTQKKKKDASSMPECQVQNKKMICKDKLSSLKLLIQRMKLSQTLAQELILKEEGLEKFWNKFSKTISKRLGLPIKTDSQDLDLKYLNGFSKSSILSSWSCPTGKTEKKTKNLQKTLCLLSQHLQPDIMEEEVIKTRKIRIFPTETQKILFNRCIGTNRFIYNKALDFIKKNPKEKINLINIRKKSMKSDKDLDEKELWQKEIPYDTRQLAIKELIEAYKKNFKKNKKFVMKFKSKKKCSDIFHVDKNALKSDFTIFSRRFKKKPLRTKFRDKKYLKNKVWGDFQILKDRVGKWYLILPIKRKNKYSSKKKSIISSLDPGERTFQTFYGDNKFGKLGDGINHILEKYNKRLDKLTSLSQNKDITSKTKCNIKRRCNLLRIKVRSIVRDLHWKSANFLCKNYKVILLPSFQTQKMTQRKVKSKKSKVIEIKTKKGVKKKIEIKFKKKRKIGKKTARKLLTLSHYLFKQRLIEKAKDFGSVVVEVNEAYTTKTCGNCGGVKEMEGNEIYSCKKCKMIADRDINAARNIYIRYLTNINAKI